MAGVVKPTGIDTSTNEIRETRKGYVSLAVQTGSNDNTALSDAIAALPTDGGVIELGKGNHYLDNFQIPDTVALKGVGSHPTASKGTVIKPSNVSSGNPVIYASGNFRMPSIEDLSIDTSGSSTNPCLRVAGSSGTSGLGFAASRCGFYNSGAMSTTGGRNGALTEVDGSASWGEIIADWYSCIWNNGGGSTTSNMYVRTTNLQMTFYSRKMLMGLGGKNIDCEASGWIKCIGRYCAANGASYVQDKDSSAYKTVTCGLTSGSRVITGTFVPEDTGHNVQGTGISGTGVWITEVTDATHAKISTAATSTTSSSVAFRRMYPTAANLGLCDIDLRGTHATVSIEGGSDEAIADLIRYSAGQYGGIVNLNNVYTAGRFNMVSGLCYLNLSGADVYNGFIYAQAGTVVVNADPVSLGGYGFDGLLAGGPGSVTLATGKVEKPVMCSYISGTAAVLFPKLHAWIHDFNLDTNSGSLRIVRQSDMPTTQGLNISQSPPTNPRLGSLRSSVHPTNGTIYDFTGVCDASDWTQGRYGTGPRRNGTDGWRETCHSQDALFTSGSPFQLGDRFLGAVEVRDYLQAQGIYIFTISSGNATTGATYTNNGQTFTVRVTVASGTTLICTGTGAPASSGTLTKASGTGDATLTFSANSADFALKVTPSGTTLNVLDGKTTPDDADRLYLQDSAAGRLGKGLTWANLKTALTSFFGSTYALLAGSISQAFSVLTLDVGNADTTISRASAGDINVEGNRVFRVGGADVPVADGGTGASTGAGAATNLGLGTGDSPQFTAVNIGHATDTTITRTGAGDIAVEGNAIYRASGTDVPVADGGTGSSTAGGARTNLGVGTGDSPTFAGMQATGVYGYKPGSGVGDSQLQSTNRTTDFTMNKLSGYILTTNESLADNTSITFKFINSFITSQKRVSLWIQQDVQSDATTIVDSLVTLEQPIRVESGYCKIRYTNKSGSATTNYTRIGFTVTDAPSS